MCRQQHYSLTELRSCYVSTYGSGFLEGFRRWRGSFLATQRNPELQGSCSIPEHCGISDRSEHKIPPNFDTLCDPFMGHLAIKWLTARPLYGSFSIRGL